MNKTMFAGLTQLEPGESLQTDNASFQSENPRIIDRLLEIGAVTHRHDGHAAQANPSSAAVPLASAVASGGVIPADVSVYVGYTLRDFEQGETVISPLVTITTEPPLDVPESAPTGTIDYTGGGLVADTYYYAISTLDAEGGETPLGPTVAVEREPGFASGRVQLSGLLSPVLAASGAAWRLWRAEGGGDLFYIASGATDTYTDDGTAAADCSLAPVDEFANLTNGDNSLLVVVPSGDTAQATASAFSVYLSTDPAFDTGALAGTFPIASAGQTLTFRNLIVEDHRPPDVSTCIPGASQIDPDTELLDWSWKRPVANAAALPVDAAEGDVRIALDTGLPHRYIGGAWDEWVIGGGGSVEVAGPGGFDLGGVTKLTFAASGAASIGVEAGGTGEAIVTVSASGSGGGGGGSGIAIHYAKVAHDEITDIEFAPDGLSAEVNFGGTAGEFATIIHKPVPRTITTRTVNLASGAADAGTELLAPGYRLIQVEVDKACRVRIYTDLAAQTADTARAIGVAPTGDHGLVYEQVFPAGDLSRRIAPNIVASVLDGAPGGGTPDVPISVLNMGTTGDVNVTLTWHQVEAFSP